MFILSELEKFNSIKTEIRSKIKIGLDEETKQSLIAEGRKDAMQSFQNMFEKSRQSFRKKSSNRNTIVTQWI
jgi:hypothetical protein